MTSQMMATLSAAPVQVLAAGSSPASVGLTISSSGDSAQIESSTALRKRLNPTLIASFCACDALFT